MNQTYAPYYLHLMYQNLEYQYFLKEIKMFSNNSAEITSMEGSFVDCEDLEFISIKGFNTKNVKSMSKLFFNTNSLSFLDIKDLNT